MVQLALYSTIAASITFVVSSFPTAAISKRGGSSKSSSGILPQVSPSYLPDFPFNGAEASDSIPTGPFTETVDLNTEDYPAPWTAPDTNHKEVQEAISAIDWAHVPDFNPRTPGEEYDYNADPACWWSNTQCTTPKIDYLPADVKMCSKVGDFGLTYDDGPLPPRSDDDEWSEPRLYDFLAEQGQEATLFYVGSNVINLPQAASRALKSGHTLCAHTWSHPQMTSLSNEEVVAQLYWSIRAIKEAAGVTTRCWRPPYGDVDDRVRAIAHQMGLSTIIWNSDSFDWSLPSIANDFGGTGNMDDVNGHFESWIEERKAGTDTVGLIVLEHETSDVTIGLAEKWLPQLKGVFNVQKVHDCAPELPSPYWES